MAHRLNRSALAFLGLLALALGTLGLLLGFGVFGESVRHQEVFRNVIGRFLGRDGAWAWPLIGLVGLLVAALALRWLIAQLRSDRVGDIQLERDRAGGRTELATGALTGALTREVAAYRGVSGAAARLIGDEHHPDLVLSVSLDERADLPAVRHRIEDEALARFREALEQPDLRARVELRPTTKAASRVT